MSNRTKLCRALGCRKLIDDNQLFCGVHFPMIPATLAQPIASNREAPAGAGQAVVSGIVAGTDAAVTFIAKREGRSSQLKTAKASGTVMAGQGGAGGTRSTGYGGGGGGGPADRGSEKLR